MCEIAESESGALLSIKPCGWYLRLQQDRDSYRQELDGMIKAFGEPLDPYMQAIIDKARAVTASWEQYLSATNVDDQAAMMKYVDSGMLRLIAALDNYDNQQATKGD